VLGTDRIRPALLALLVGSLFLACDDQAPNSTFVIDVERIEAPATLPSGESFEIRLHGTIGPDLCHGFDRYDTRRTQHGIEITAIGRRERGAQVCATAIAALRGEPPIVVTRPFVGPFRVVVHRPDGSTLEVEIPAEP
jgi:hypothetical protein